MDKQILSVSQLNEYLRSMMDMDPLLMQTAVRGEISNYKMYPSGHHYFTLKDENASLRCVLFKGNAFRLRFRPENGMRIIAMGKVSVYPRDGAYQLVCASLMPDGVGDLHTAFEQLKAKLAAKGLFEPSHKKPIPQYPGTIGIITSPAGAAVHDMIRILNHRFPLTQVRLFPARVQGAEAPYEIASAIKYANQHHLADVLIVGRGGGSIEDLWAFNDEVVAYAIYDSEIPVISAVGHEPDVTISDFVADLRAATPSNAAELAVPSAEALSQNLDSYTAAMIIALKRQLQAARARYSSLAGSAVLESPTGYLNQKRKDIKILEQRLSSAQNIFISSQRRRYIGSLAKLEMLSPLKVLARGYSLAEDENGTILRSTDQLSEGDHLFLRLQDGKIEAKVINRWREEYESQDEVI